MTKKWVSVTTVHAPMWLIKLHARYMRSIGAEEAIYFLDAPEFFSSEEIQTLSSIATVVTCDSSYWYSQRGRPQKAPERQRKNISFARRTIDAEWFLSIDLDEFLYIPTGVSQLVDSVAKDVSEIHISNVERILITGGKSWHNGVLRIPNVEKEKQLAVYGPMAAFLGNGLCEYYHGKAIVRKKRGLVQAGHGAFFENSHREVVRYSPEISKAAILHYSCMSKHHYLHRVQSKIFVESDKKSFKLAHQYALENWIRAGTDVADRVEQSYYFMYTSTAERAVTWIEAGLCARIPQGFIETIEGATSSEDELDLSYVDKSFSDFYR